MPHQAFGVHLCPVRGGGHRESAVVGALSRPPEARAHVLTWLLSSHPSVQFFFFARVVSRT